MVVPPQIDQNTLNNANSINDPLHVASSDNLVMVLTTQHSIMVTFFVGVVM
jgi:hypothetical protein